MTASGAGYVRAVSARNRLVAARGPLYAIAAIGFIAAIYIRTEWLELTVLTLAIASWIAALTASVMRWQDRRNSTAADQQD